MDHATSPAMALVDDELLNFKCPLRLQEFRLRIWRGPGVPAVVLVTAENDEVPPGAVTTRLANLVFHAYLTYNAQGMYYFEAERDGTVHSIDFDIFGFHGRSRLKDPRSTLVKKRELDDAVGEVVEL